MYLYFVRALDRTENNSQLEELISLRADLTAILNNYSNKILSSLFDPERDELICLHFFTAKKM